MVNPRNEIKEYEIIFNEKEDIKNRLESIRKLKDMILKAIDKITCVKQIDDDTINKINVLINVIRTEEIDHVLLCDSIHALGKIKHKFLSQKICYKNEIIKNLIELYKKIESYNNPKQEKKAIKINIIYAFMKIAIEKSVADQLKNEIIIFNFKESNKEIRRFLDELKKQCESFYGRDYRNYISDSEINPLNYIED